MDLPPLFFDGRGLYAHPARVDYKVTSPLAGAGGQRNKFPTELLGCYTVNDAGLNCCVAHCCCGPCIWDTSMKLAGVEGSQMAAGATLFAQAAQNSANQAEPGTARASRGGAIAGAASAVATWARAGVRQNLMTRLYPERAPEAYAWSLFIHACCAPCAWVQETNAVMVWAYETKGTVIRYGSVSNCGCAQFEGPGGLIPITPLTQWAPLNNTIEREEFMRELDSDTSWPGNGPR